MYAYVKRAQSKKQTLPYFIRNIRIGSDVSANALP